MRIFSISIQNQKGRPNEDFYLVSKKSPIFAVADGVSRIKNPDGSYPKVSGARLAAEEFCKSTTNYLEKNFKNANSKTLRKAFNFANKAIFNLNKKYGINKKSDYLENDFFCTCGAVAFIKNNILYYGYVGDCGIRIYNKNDFLKFISIDDVSTLEEWRDNQKFKSKKERLLIWRKILRNKPKAPYLTYGVFTGEKEVKYYYHVGEIKLHKRDLIFIYSDGFVHFIAKTDFRNFFREFEKEKLEEKIKKFCEKEIPGNLKTTEIFSDDKTLISILI